MLNSTAIEGLKRFLQHAETLNPKNNPRGENGFAKEFQEIKDLTSRLKKNPDFSTKQGEKEINRSKNRYKDILPYDYTRIILPEINGIDGSDYINGNYIKGPTDEVFYLTAQGPLPQTVDDFWRMIVAHKIQVIVMACREYELGKLKCKRYWPESLEETMDFGGYKISLISQDEMGDGFIIRTLSAKSAKEEFKVTQFHYTAWPDHDVPRSATPLIELTMSFRAFVGNDNKVPVLVHCSAGCGRTGTICALDYAWTLIKLGRTETFNVFEIVSKLRRQRIAMVQTKEQYALVYKAVRELVLDEMKKQRVSAHTYVNVSVGGVGEEPKEEQMYENVDFIRSIQRLHQEEKNASRKPMSARETCPLSDMALIPAPKKELVLAEKKNLLAYKKNDNQSNQYKETPIQLSKEASKENLVQTSNKPRPNQRPSGGYENVLPLTSGKPPLAPRPAQNYVNVAIESSDEQHDDYVNVASALAKTVPVPTAKNESTTKFIKPVPVPPGINSTIPSGDQAKPVPLPIKSDVSKKLTSKKETDYEIPPQKPQKIQSQVSTESDYVISPSLAKSSPTIQPKVNEGQLIDLGWPEPKSSRVQNSNTAAMPNKVYQHKPKPVRQSSFNKEPKPNQETSNHQANKNTRTTAVIQQVRTSKPSGQYSLVGALDSPRSPQNNINDPFDNASKTSEDERTGVAQTKGRHSLGMVESVVSDGSSVNLEKPIVSPRRLSEGSNISTTKSDEQGFFGTYSVVNKEKANQKERILADSNKKPQPTGPDLETPCVLQPLQNSCGKGPSNSPKQLGNGPIQKAYSTENVHTRIGNEQSSVESNLSDYTLVSSPYLAKKTGASTSALYSIADNEAGLVKPKPTIIRRSNSGISLTPASISPGDNMEGLYATVGARGKKRTPLSSETWTSNGHLPSKEQEMRRSQNSTSSLRSVNSASSIDSSDDIPPVPAKTINAYISPGDEDAYEAVQKPSFKSSTIDRFKAKARNIMTTGPQVTKISFGKKGLSPSHTPRSASPVLGEGAALAGCQLGYGNRVTKPSGPRTCPSHWSCPSHVF